MSLETQTYSSVSGMIVLVKTGDGASLGHLRESLGRSPAEIAAAVGVSERKLLEWENGKGSPTSGQAAKWRLAFCPDVDNRISNYLSTDNPEVLHHFWELA
ncbi:helix-turn-helix transcriptional regulator [Dehalogenimonas sp. THU2]|uniref:helix-turn-helix domain-containing protein n=1 Tax=Dehalogenimonas sp. THU2 TaxID=3151121 RepID=UPI003218576F